VRFISYKIAFWTSFHIQNSLKITLLNAQSIIWMYHNLFNLPPFLSATNNIVMNNFIDTQIDFHATDYFVGYMLEVNVNFPAMLSRRTDMYLSEPCCKAWPHHPSTCSFSWFIRQTKKKAHCCFHLQFLNYQVHVSFITCISFSVSRRNEPFAQISLQISDCSCHGTFCLLQLLTSDWYILASQFSICSFFFLSLCDFFWHACFNSHQMQQSLQLVSFVRHRGQLWAKLLLCHPQVTHLLGASASDL